MDASFADYTVTKVDADRFVKQPMRTYGKRSAGKLRVYGKRKDDATDDQDSSATPTPTSSTTATPSTAPAVASTTTDGPDEAEDAPPAKRLKSSQARCSILSYYKPVPAAVPSVANVVREEKASTELTASLEPCREMTQATTKRRRILKIRPTEPPSPHITRQAARSTTSSPPPEDKENKGRSEQDSEAGTEEDVTGRAPSAKTATATVQTTLNISAKPSFSECKVCDTVWNPLYPDDEKYHRKRHAAVLRAKKRKASVLD